MASWPERTEAERPRPGLAPRVVALAIAAVSVTAAASAFLAYREIHRALVRHELESLGTLADLEESRIRARVEMAQSVVTVLANDEASGIVLQVPPLRVRHGGERLPPGHGAEELRHHFLETLGNHPEYRDLALLRAPGGEEVFRAEQSADGVPAVVPPRVGASRSVPRGSGTGISGPLFAPPESPTAAPDPVVLAWAAVRDTENLPQGYVVASVGLGDVVSRLARSLSRDYAVLLADREGRSLVRFEGKTARKTSREGEGLAGTYPVLADPIRNGANAVQSVQSGPAADAGELLALRRVALGSDPSQDLLLAVVLPDAPLQRNGEKLRNRILLTAGVGLALLIPVVATLAVRSLRPLHAMAGAAERVGRGEPPGILPTDAGGEVGVLARSLRDMATEVRARTEALQAEVERRRAAEGATLDANERLSMALSISRALSWEWDTGTERGRYSEDYASYFGLPPGSLAGDADVMLNAVHPEDRDRVAEASRVAYERREPFRVEFRGAGPDERWYVSHGRVLPAVPPGTYRMVGLTLEITDRKRYERALAESEERYRRLVDVLPLALLVHRQGTIVFANPAAADVFGVARPDDLLGLPVLELVHPDERDSVRERIRHATDERGSAPLIEERLLRRDGSEFPAEVAGVSLPEAGEPAMLVVARDVSERKRSQAERERIERRLRETQKLESLGVLAGGIAHDFNNILTGVLGNVTLARSRVAADSGTARYLASIEEAALRAADLCRQMLAYSGRGSFVVGPVDLSALVRETLSLLELSITKRARLELHLAEDLPAVRADAVQLRQILMNLVINASDALGERSGSIRVSTGVEEVTDTLRRGFEFGHELSAGPHPFLEVSDDGVGMEPDIVDRIFDPFFTTKFTGRGLGLSAVLGIVKGHDGTIRVVSRPGSGTAFRLLLPPGPSPVGPDVPAESEVDSSWARGGTALVVDDEDAVRHVTCDMLRALGFDVVEARDGREGLDLFLGAPERFRFVLLDLTMPNLDGAGAFARMREAHAGLRAILMSGFSEEEVRDRFAESDVAGFLQKPFGLKELRACLGAALARGSGEGEVA